MVAVDKLCFDFLVDVCLLTSCLLWSSNVLIELETGRYGCIAEEIPHRVTWDHHCLNTG